MGQTISSGGACYGIEAASQETTTQKPDSLPTNDQATELRNGREDQQSQPLPPSNPVYQAQAQPCAPQLSGQRTGLETFMSWLGGEASDTEESGLLSTHQPTPTIYASSIPLWTWNNVQCIKWLTLVLMDRCHVPRDEARRVAREVLYAEGSGAPVMYTTSHRTWKTLLGPKKGWSIYTHLVGLREKSGTVPQAHFVIERTQYLKDYYRDDAIGKTE